MPDSRPPGDPIASPGDPPARQSPFLFWVFGWYLRWLFWRRFNGVRLSRTGLPQVPPGRPIIICSTIRPGGIRRSSSCCRRKLFPGRTGFGPMDAEALGKYGLLERMGVFGIELDTPRGAARFLRTCSQILSEPKRVLWITAQGEFADVRQRPLRLRPGLAHLLRRVPDAVVLPLALEYSFLERGASRKRWPGSARRSRPGRSAASPSGRRGSRTS